MSSNKIVTLEKEKYINYSEYDAHHNVYFFQDKDSGLHGFIAIHRDNKVVPSFGATRFWQYETEEDALHDALRLSRGMSYKNAMAGLQYGGAKGVIIVPKGDYSKGKILKAYAKVLNEINGKFITGTDVGLTQSDLFYMMKMTKFLVGSKCNPEKATATGLYYSVQEVLEFRFGSSTVSGHSFAIQGLGKVGSELLALIYDEAKEIYVADINKEIVEKIKKEFPKVIVVDTENIHKQDVDIYSPCALSGALNKQTLPELKCKIIVGSANNQLEDIGIADELHKINIIYCPDYLVNAGGLIAVVDEYEHGDSEPVRLSERVLSIKSRLGTVLQNAKIENASPQRIADKMAEQIVNRNK